LARTRTRKQQLVPIFKWRKIIQNVQFFTRDEQLMLPEAAISSFSTGQAFMYVAAKPVLMVAIPFVKDPFSLCPNSARRWEADLRSRLLLLPEYETPERIAQQQRQFLNALLTEIDGLGGEKRLPPPDTDDDSIIEI